MQSGTAMGEVSNYLQPDHFDNDKNNMNNLLGQNPLLLLARTCQNIGVEGNPTTSTSAPGDTSRISYKGSLFSSPPSSNKSSNRASSQIMLPRSQSKFNGSTTQIHTYPPVSSHSPTNNAALPIPQTQSASSHSSEERDLCIPPSSNSLIQLARLSSSLKLPSPSASSTVSSAERQKRTHRPATGVPASTLPNAPHLQKRSRRQYLGRNSCCSSKPIDFSSHFSSNSSPLSSSSSVSPSSLRSTPLTHTSPPPPTQQVQQQQQIPPTPATNPLEAIKSLMDFSATGEQTANPSVLEAFYNMSSHFGSSPNSVRELLFSVAQSLTDRTPPEAEPPKPSSVSDPSTQCLYCGHVCSDMGNLVHHIYTHLASLHKQQAESVANVAPSTHLPLPIASAVHSVTPANSLLDLASCYSRFFQKNPEHSPLQTVHFPSAHQASPAASATDPNALFLAWLNVLNPAYREALSGSHR